MNLTKANESRLAELLAKQVNTNSYGITTWANFVQRRLLDGGRLELAQVDDETAKRKAEREYEAMRTSSNWVPTGNSSHPRTIRYNELKTLVEGPCPQKNEYRIYSANGGFCVLPKLVYDWAVSL